jgi:hypothetical protein
MHFVSKPAEVDTGHAPRPDEQRAAALDEARQAAASLLDAAMLAEDPRTRKALRRRAAQLISPRRGGRNT